MGDTEDHYVEQPTVQLIQNQQGWNMVNCYVGQDGATTDLGRDGKQSSPRLKRPKREAVLTSGLKSALHRLNPDLPLKAIEGAVEEICRDRTALFWRRRTGGLTSNNANF